MPSEEYESFLSSLKSNDVESCERIISQSPQILAEKDDSGRNILHQAVLEDKHDITVFLSHSHKSLLNEADYEGKTPLYIAAEQGKESHVRTLLIEKADPNVETPNIYTFKRVMPILLNVIPNRHSKISRMLVEAGADLRMADSEDTTPLHLAVIYGDPILTEDILRKNPAIADAQDQDGNTALHFAAQYNDKFVFLLLEHGANPSLTNKDGMNALHFAASSKGADALQTLLVRRPDLINSQDNLGRTPLHIAREFENEAAKKTLIEEGARQDIVDREGNTAYMRKAAIDERKGYEDSYRWLLEGQDLETEQPKPSSTPRDRSSSNNSLASTVRSDSPESLGASPRDRAGSRDSTISISNPSPVRLRDALEAAPKTSTGKPPLASKGTPAKGSRSRS